MTDEVDRPQAEESDPDDESRPATGPTRRRTRDGPEAGSDPGAGVVPAGGREVDPFPGLQAPVPTAPDPGTPQRVVAFVSILVGGLLGGLIGYGIGDLLWAEPIAVAAVAMIGALVGAVGVGVLANLTLRAMGEWKAIEHPEADR